MSVSPGDPAMIDYTLLVGVTLFDLLRVCHSSEWGASRGEPNMHGLC